ncbi:MAG: hypothetical protein WC526_00780 [Patescibacteria group bacterium]
MSGAANIDDMADAAVQLMQQSQYVELGQTGNIKDYLLRVSSTGRD